MKPGLYIIINLLHCKHPADKLVRASAPPGSVSGGLGKAVEVIGPPTFDCGCCVAVMPTWVAFNDPRGLVTRKDNLAPIGHDPDAVTEPTEQEVTCDG